MPGCSIIGMRFLTGVGLTLCLSLGAQASLPKPGGPMRAIDNVAQILEPPQGPEQSSEEDSSGIQRQINTFGSGATELPVRVIPSFWRTYPAGAHNAITDVPGLQVGHVTLTGESPRIRTGITAIVPNVALLTSSQGNLANTGFWAAGAILNGNGELTGLGPLETSGVLNSPILLTNTYAVGVAHQGVFDYYRRDFPGQWPGLLPVVGECFDGFYNTIQVPVLKPGDAVAAIASARSGPVPQGRVGAGTGMRSFELHAGIGSASRVVTLNGRQYTIGVLVNANHSRLDRLNPLLKDALAQYFAKSLDQVKEEDDRDRASLHTSATSRQGSIIVVIATDLPLNVKALHMLAERAGLGIANTGSVMATTSGDFAVAFSTANPVLLGDTAPTMVPNTTVHPDALTPVLQATVEAVTEAQINAIVAAHFRAGQ